MSVMETRLIAMSNIIGRAGALYEILIYSPRRERLREGEFTSDIRAMLLWQTDIISLKNMEQNRNYYYDIGKRYLWMIGQWPYQKPRMRLSFLALVVIVLANCLFTQIAQIFVCEDTQCIFQTLPPHLLVWNSLVKVLAYRFNSEKIKDLTDHLFVDWDTLETQEEREILKKYAENGRWYSLIYASYCYVSTVSFITTSLVPRIMDIVFPLNTSRPIMLAYPAHYFVNEEQYFYFIFCHMLITALICMTGLIAHDCMFFIYIEHVCGLFAVVGFRFKNALDKCDIARSSLIDCPDNLYHKNITFSIHAHREALQFAKLIENAFSVPFAIQLMISTMSISVSLLQFSMQLNDLMEAMRYFVYILAQLFHLFCFSFQGQKLIDHSIEICDKIYNSAWYEIPVKGQKLLLFTMRKSIEASTLTACKIYVFSLQNFTTVLQSAMSYFTVLASFSE
ncbi:odorant receptor 13a-like [Formica exsecta]|uniref:odorant receptor 13a-like n=1 Tax=Formica exsecta TaxID=72781 RepID=UPI0011440D07|nr:odorant receptor 13a-like [Formica exsecta]